jgi:hypothetical protein
MSNIQATRNWLQRARAEVTRTACPSGGTATGSRPRVATGSMESGDVWLSRIERPRRRFARAPHMPAA